MSPDPAAVEPMRALPSDVEWRLSFWRGLWHRSSAYHYFFGVISVAASVISTSLDGQEAKYFSIIAAISTALIGFMHPERRYIKFVRAWRVLDVASMRYRHGLIDKAQLIDAVERGESLIAEFEDRSDADQLAKDQAARDAEAAASQPPAPVPVESTGAMPAAPMEGGDPGGAAPGGGARP